MKIRLLTGGPTSCVPALRERDPGATKILEVSDRAPKENGGEDPETALSSSRGQAKGRTCISRHTEEGKRKKGEKGRWCGEEKYWNSLTRPPKKGGGKTGGLAAVYNTDRGSVSRILKT